VARAGAVAALAAVAAAFGFASTGQGETPDAPAVGLYPTFRPVGDLGGPGGASTDAGVGVFPELSEPQSLAFPGPAAIQAAHDYAARRRGRVSFAVADPRGGIAGRGVDRGYRSASLVKAMILVAYLDQVERDGQGLSEADVARLDAMIRVSDNDSASSTFRRLAPGALTGLARRAGMRSFAVAPEDWGSSRVTAADQVRLFLSLDRLLPAPRRLRYARYLLSHVASFHAWGIPQAGRPHWRVLFKGGWRGGLVHQAALLERGSRRVAIAVLTGGNPSESYGRRTVRGIAHRLLHTRERPAPAAPSLRPLGELSAVRGS
jgi:Beta-lactamase enzyme family